VADGGVAEAVDEFQVRRLHRVGAGAVLHLDPAVGELGEAPPRFDRPVVETGTAPLLGALDDLIRREEEGRRGAGELGGGRPWQVPVRGADQHAVGQPVAIGVVHGGAHVCVAGDVDERRSLASQVADVVVGDDAVVHAEPFDERDVARRGQAYDVDRCPLLEQEGGADGGLARRAGHDDRLGAEECVVVEKVVDEEGREEQRPEHHAVVLERGIFRRVGVDPAVPVVGARQRCAMRRGVDESPRVHATGCDHEVRRRREIAVDTGARCDVIVRACDDLGVSPHGNPSPYVRVRRREEVPVLECIAQYGVGDVVGRESETVDAQQRLPWCRVGRGPFDDPALVDVGPLDLEVHRQPRTARASAASSMWPRC
jgi:hypothetical protein